MTEPFVNPSWMPHSVSEAAKAGDATADDLVSGPRGRTCSTRSAKAAEVVSSNASARNPADLAAGLPAPARPPVARGGPGAARRPRPRAGRQPFRRRQRLQVGHGLPRLHLHGRAAAGRRVVPHLGQPRHRPLRRAAVDGRHGLLGQRPARRARPRARTARSS